MSQLPAVPAYRPRPIRPLVLAPVEGWRIKWYGLAVASGPPRPELATAARAAARATLPAPGADGNHAVGFVVAHDARPACFVLVNWWVGVDLHQRYLRAPLDRPAALTPWHTSAIGCVWELAVAAHEHRAWIRHVLTDPAQADLDGYLADQLDQRDEG